jgi:hypothetical protein
MRRPNPFPHLLLPTENSMSFIREVVHETYIPVRHTADDCDSRIRVTAYKSGDIEVLPLAVGVPIQSIEDLDGYIDALHLAQIQLREWERQDGAQ